MVFTLLQFVTSLPHSWVHYGALILTCITGSISVSLLGEWVKFSLSSLVFLLVIYLCMMSLMSPLTVNHCFGLVIKINQDLGTPGDELLLNGPILSPSVPMV